MVEIIKVSKRIPSKPLQTIMQSEVVFGRRNYFWLSDSSVLTVTDNGGFVDEVSRNYCYCSFDDLFLLVPSLETEQDSNRMEIKTLADRGLSTKRASFRYALNILSNHETSRWLEYDLKKQEPKKEYRFKDDKQLNTNFFSRKRLLSVTLSCILCMILTENGLFFEDPILSSNKRIVKEKRHRKKQYSEAVDKFYKGSSCSSLFEKENMWFHEYSDFLQESEKKNSLVFYKENYTLLCEFFTFIFSAKTLRQVKNKKVSPFFIYYIENSGIFFSKSEEQIAYSNSKAAGEMFQKSIDKKNEGLNILSLSNQDIIFGLFTKLCKPIVGNGEVKKLIEKNDQQMDRLKKKYPKDPTLDKMEREIKDTRNKFSRALSGNSIDQLLEEQEYEKKIRSIE